MHQEEQEGPRHEVGTQEEVRLLHEVLHDVLEGKQHDSHRTWDNDASFLFSDWGFYSA